MIHTFNLTEFWKNMGRVDYDYSGKQRICREVKNREQQDIFKKNLKKILGNKCANCGSEVDIEYHYIVPLSIGGTNRITNFVPLCYNCHQLTHGCRYIRQICRSKNTGRKRNELPKNYTDILDKYMNGDIGKKECEKQLGINGKNKLNDRMFFKEYLRDKGIVSYKNRVDMLNTEKCKRRDHTGEFIAKVTFSDGTQKIRYIK